MGNFPDLPPLDRIPAIIGVHRLLLQHLYANAIHRGLLNQSDIDKIIGSIKDDAIRQLAEGFFDPFKKVDK